MTTAASAGPGRPTDARSPSSLKRIRVLHVIPSLFSGGMERFLIELMRASTPVGGAGEACRVTHGVCILRAADDRLFSQCKSLATTWVLGRRKTRDWSCWKQIRQVIRDFEPDVVEALSTGAWVDAARAVGRSRSTRLSLVFHGQIDTVPAGRIRRWLNRWAVRRAATVISVSREAVDRMIKEWHIPAAKMVAVPNGVDVNRFHPASSADERLRVRRRLEIPDGSKVAICVANLVPIKAVDVLLDAWRQLSADQRDARLLLVGDGPLRRDWQNLAETLGCHHSVSFLGNRDDVPALLRAADLFVSSSRYEACSMAILEAMASGLAVVVTDVGGNGELVEPDRTGWLVPPDRADLLAQSLAAALNDDQTRMRFGQTARAFVMERHDLEACVRQYSTIYHSLTLPHSKRPATASEESECAA
ncbi:MAG: glycosyltransferase [Phycisphaerae bacterium]